MTPIERLHHWKRRYPQVLHPEAFRAEARDLYHYDLLRGIPGAIVDLGGGFATHNLLLAEDGISVTVVDTFSAYWSESKDLDPADLVRMFEQAGVRMLDRELQDWAPADANGGQPIGAFFSAHCLEHFHRSPLPMLRRCVAALAPSGRMILCVPNAVNLRKRFAVLAGRTNLPPFEEFFHNSGRFHGHIREYCVDDLNRLAAELSLTEPSIYGRNWLGLARLEGSVPAPVFAAMDALLRIRPGFCSDIYLRGVKP